jgi:Ca2+-binding EF-hand superfamily protein
VYFGYVYGKVHDDDAIKDMFDSLDVDHKGEICYRELLMAYADMKINSRQERLYRAFHHMQKHEPNKDRITIDDILDIVKGMKSVSPPYFSC